jgi:hypothetical protein
MADRTQVTSLGWAGSRSREGRPRPTPRRTGGWNFTGTRMGGRAALIMVPYYALGKQRPLRDTRVAAAGSLRVASFLDITVRHHELDEVAVANSPFFISAPGSIIARNSLAGKGVSNRRAKQGVVQRSAAPERNMSVGLTLRSQKMRNVRCGAAPTRTTLISLETRSRTGSNTPTHCHGFFEEIRQTRRAPHDPVPPLPGLLPPRPLQVQWPSRQPEGRRAGRRSTRSKGRTL